MPMWFCGALIPFLSMQNVSITLVDGIMFYNELDELAKQIWIQKERTRLINEMIQAKQSENQCRSRAYTLIVSGIVRHYGWKRCWKLAADKKN
jgi:hypothetical protein